MRFVRCCGGVEFKDLVTLILTSMILLRPPRSLHHISPTPPSLVHRIYILDTVGQEANHKPPASPVSARFSPPSRDKAIGSGKEALEQLDSWRSRRLAGRQQDWTLLGSLFISTHHRNRC